MPKKLVVSISLSITSSSSVMSSQASLKIAYNGEIHRSRVDLNVFHLRDLERLVAQTFQLEPSAFVIQYTDAEGDRLNVSSDAEYAEACRVFLTQSSDAVKSLKFVAVSRHQAAFQEKVTDPIVTSIEQLIAALNVTLEKVKSEHWAAHAHATGDALTHAALDARESLDAARHVVEAFPHEHKAPAPAAGGKSAAEGFSSFAQGLVGQIKQFIPEKKDAAPAPAAAPKPEPEVKAPAPAPAPVAVPVPAPVAVPEPAPVAVPAAPVAAPEAPVVAAGVPVAFSESELKWADELSLVHNIFPNVSSARVIDMLEQCDGNVNVVLNTLMEDA